MNKRARRMWRNGWISMTALTAVIILLGVGLAFGMDALLPSYTGRLLPLSEDLLPPVYEMSDQSLTIYPWNLYTEEAAAPLDHEEQLSLQQHAQQIMEIIGILWQKEYIQAESENEIVWELPDVSSVMQDFTRGKAVDGSPLYFLK